MKRVSISDDIYRALEFIMQESYCGDRQMTNKECDNYINSIVEDACNEYFRKWQEEYDEKLKR